MNEDEHKDHGTESEQAILRSEETREKVKALIDRHKEHGQDPQLARQLLANVEETIEKQRQLRVAPQSEE